MDEATRYEATEAALTGDPRRRRALLFAHSPDRRGNCHSCPGERWPCRAHRAAESAEQLATAESA